MTHGKEIRDRFVDRRAEGKALGSIAEELGIARNTAANWNRELEETIRAAKGIKDEEVLERYRMKKEKRLEDLGERLLAAQEAISRIDLSTITPKQLIEFESRWVKEFRELMPNPKIYTDEEMAIEKKLREDRDEFERRLIRR